MLFLKNDYTYLQTSSRQESVSIENPKVNNREVKRKEKNILTWKNSIFCDYSSVTEKGQNERFNKGKMLIGIFVFGF